MKNNMVELLQVHTNELKKLHEDVAKAQKALAEYNKNFMNWLNKETGLATDKVVFLPEALMHLAKKYEEKGKLTLT